MPSTAPQRPIARPGRTHPPAAEFVVETRAYLARQFAGQPLLRRITVLEAESGERRICIVDLPWPGL